MVTERNIHGRRWWVLVFTFTYACYGGAVDIDRTQPNKVQKEIFTGEWYFMPTVVEVDYQQGIVFEGAQGKLERIRWEIRQDMLVGYRSYEVLMGAEEGNGSPEFNGGPVVAFPISSHFDVIREYNPRTGAQSNVLVESEVERHWSERTWMRVDWSQNLVNDPYNFFDALDAFAVPRFEQDGVDNPHRPEISATNINVVGSYLMQPDYRTCANLFDDYFCGPTQARVKLSFKKVEGNRWSEDGRNLLSDYEPVYYPDVMPIRYADGTPVTRCFSDGFCQRETVPVFERFGYFRHQRLAYDSEFQWTRDGRVFLGHRHNLWTRTRDAQGRLIDPAHRYPRKIIYYTNVDFPEDADAWAAAFDIAADWDEALRRTVAELRRLKGIATDWQDIEPIFEVRENSCNVDNVNRYADTYALRDELQEAGIEKVTRGNLLRACAVLEWFTRGEPGGFTWEKAGDIRYHHFNWVDTPMASGPLGYGPSGADPVTGEIISAAANVYGASIDTLASYAADVISLMNGKLDLEDVATGETVRAHMRRVADDTSKLLSTFKQREFHTTLFNRRDAIFNGEVPRLREGVIDPRFNPARSLPPPSDVPLAPVTDPDARLRQAAGTPLERELLVNDMLVRAMSVSQEQGAGSAPEAFSPLEFMLDHRGQLYHESRMELAKHSVTFAGPEDWADPGLASLAKELAHLDYNEVYAFMRRKIFQGVQAHEVGHTLGLRHNFRGSFDALNYHPEFWTSWDPVSGEVRYRDPDNNEPTSAERYKYSSIMDYDARFYGDNFHGIGPYDVAAIKFGYGTLVETYPEDDVISFFGDFRFFHGYHAFPKLFSPDVPCRANGLCDPSSTAGSDLLTWSSQRGIAERRSDAARDALEQGDLTAWAELTHEQEVAEDIANRYLMTYLRDALDEVHVDVPCSASNNYCGIWNREHVLLEDIMQRWTNYYEGVADEVPLDVPYYFCTDENAGYSWVECQPYDKGATYHEVTVDRMQRYDAYYFFTNFRRDDATFGGNRSLSRYIDRVYNRTFNQMSNVFRYTLRSEADLGRDKSGNLLTIADFPVGRDWQAAGVEGLNFLAQVLQQPEPGHYCLREHVEYALMEAGDTCATVQSDYCLDAVDAIYRPLPEGDVCPSGEVRSYCQESHRVYAPLPAGEVCPVLPGEAEALTLDIEPGVGKYYYTTWTNEYYYRPTRIGAFYDKYLALFALTDNEGFFYRDVSSLFDAGAFQLSYWSGGLHQEILQLFAGPFDQAPGPYAWRYDASLEGVDRFRPMPVVDVYEDAPDASLPRIQPSSSYTLDWYELVLPIARFNSLFDYSADYLNYARVCLAGYIDCLEYADLPGGDPGYVEYVDPLTGWHYVAAVTDKPDLAIAAKALRAAEEFKLRVYQPARDAYEAVDDTHPDYENLRRAYEQAEAEINRISANLDIARQWGAAFGGAWR